MGKLKKYWWITMSANGHFRTLKIKNRRPAEGEIHNEKWQNCLFFDNEEAAVDFCKKLKNFINKEYPRAIDQEWFSFITIIFLTY